MSDNINPSADIFTHLRSPKMQAFVADVIEESLLEVNAFEKLHHLAEREFAMEHYLFIEDPNGVAILCRRDGKLEEVTFAFTGAMIKSSAMPYNHFKDLNKSESWAPSAHQYVVLTMPGQPYFDDVKKAISNLHVMARLRRGEGSLKALNDLVVDGEDAICVSTAISTPRSRMLDDDEPLVLTREQDPRGIVTQYVNQRDHVVLVDNQVDVYLAEHLQKAGSYELHGGVCGPLLRAGQIVRVEVGFRIVPAGWQSVLRMDLKSVVIIDDDIVTTIAFAQADAEAAAREAAKAAKKAQTISISSAGPFGVAIKEKSKVKRAGRKPKNLAKDDLNEAMLDDLPFAPK